MSHGLTEWEAKEMSEDWIKEQDAKKRRAQLRIQALGAALSRRDWDATVRAYEAIRNAFDRPENA